MQILSNNSITFLYAEQVYLMEITQNLLKILKLKQHFLFYYVQFGLLTI